MLTQLYLDVSRCDIFLTGYLNYTEAKAVAGCTVSQGLPNDFRLWLQADIQSLKIDFRLYEALAVKVVLVCVA